MKKLVCTVIFLMSVPAFAVYVNGHYRNDGTYVQPYYRTAPDSTPYNNRGYYEGTTTNCYYDTYLQKTMCR